MHRGVGIVFGIGNHILFAFTVWRLFWFLKGTEPLAASCGSLLADFGVGHILRNPSQLFAPAGRTSTTDPAFARCVLR